MATTSTRDFASAGASAAMREKRVSRAGLQLVKTVSRATEAAKDKVDPHVSVTQVREVRKASISRQGLAELDPEHGAFETVNYVLRTLGNRLGSAGLVSLPSLDRALTSATAAVLFSAEASPLFESLREQAHDLILVNSVFCAIYFVGFVTVRLAGTLPHYKATYTPIGTKVIQQFFHAALGEEASKNHEEENRAAYRTLSTAIDLLHPERSGPGIFPGFPKLDTSTFSPTGFLTVRENKNMMEKLVYHFSKHGFPQPLMNEERTSSERGRERPPQDTVQIRDWRFLSGDDNTKSYEVAHSDKHIGENFGRVVYWLICSAYRLGPGQAVVVYHQQHIQLVRWLGDRFGYKVLGMATDLDWSGKHFDVNPKLKAMIREWLVIVPSPNQRKKRRSRQNANSNRSHSEKRSAIFEQQALPRPRSREAEDAHLPKANTKEIRRPAVRPGRSVSFAESEPIDIDRQSRLSNTSGSSSGVGSLQRITSNGPLRSAIKRSNSHNNDSPPRPARPDASDIPDMREVDKRTGDIPCPASLVAETGSSGTGSVAHHRQASSDSSQRRLQSGSPKLQTNTNVGLPPFVKDMSSRTSPASSPRSSRDFADGVQTVAHNTPLQASGEQSDLHRTNTVTSDSSISALPGAIYIASQADQQYPPPIPSKSPRRSPATTPPPIDDAVSKRPTSYYEDYSVNTKEPPVSTYHTTVPSHETFAEQNSAVAVDGHHNNRPPYGGPDAFAPNNLTPSGQGSQMAAAAAYDVGSEAMTPKAPAALLAENSMAASSISSVSAAPSWPSSIASVPSSFPGTPTQSGNFDQYSTAATSLVLDDVAARSRRKAPPPPQKGVPAVALYDFNSEDPEEELAFKKGEQLEIIERNEDLEEDGWCKARLNGRTGLVPLAYIEIVPPTPTTNSDGARTAGASSVGDDSVSLWSGFNQVIGWTRLQEYQSRTSEMTWNDVDADEFDDDNDSNINALKDKGKEKETRSRSNSTLRTAVQQTRLPEFLDPSHLSPSLDASPLPSRALSEYDSASVDQNAAPDPLFSLSKTVSHLALREDDTDLTPTEERSSRYPGRFGFPYGGRDYFEPDESVSGDTDVSDSESRIASFDARPRFNRNDTDAATVIGGESPAAAAGPAPRFWDDVSGGITAAPSVKSAPVRLSERWDDVGTRLDEVRSETAETVSSDHAPRFWDDVSGGVGTDPQAPGCRQS